MTVNGLASEQTNIVFKAHGRFVPNQELATDALLAKATKIAKLLMEGKNAEAILLASFVDWRSGVSHEEKALANKANYDPSEPRDDRGRWTSAVAQTNNRNQRSPQVVPVASADDPRGNKMARDAANAAGLNRAQRRQLLISLQAKASRITKSYCR